MYDVYVYVYHESLQNACMYLTQSNRVGTQALYSQHPNPLRPFTIMLQPYTGNTDTTSGQNVD